MPWDCSWAYLNENGQVEHHIHETMLESAPNSIRIYLAHVRAEGYFSKEEEEFLLRRYANHNPVPDQIVFEGVDKQWDREDNLAAKPTSKTKQEHKVPPPPPAPRKQKSEEYLSEPRQEPLPTPVHEPLPDEKEEDLRPKGRKKTNEKNPDYIGSVGKGGPPPPPPPAKKREKGKGKIPNKEPVKTFTFRQKSKAPQWKYGPKHIPGSCTSTKNGFNIIVHSNEKPKKFESQQANSASADIVFLIDSSGSMTGEMKAVKKTCIAFAEHIQREANSTTKLALVTYGIGRLENFDGATSKNHGEYNTISWPLMTPSDFHSVVNKHLKVGISGGGGCYVAQPGTAIVFQEVLAQFGSHGLLKGIGKALSRNHAKFIIHISDEYDYTGKEKDLPQILRDCKKHSVVVHTMGIDSVGHKEISSQTGGVFWDIEKTQGVGDLSSILTEVSSEIAKALSVQNKAQKGKSTHSAGPSCTQTDSARRARDSTEKGGAGTRSVSIADDNEGWSIINNFRCHFCESTNYAICPDCSTHLCFGDVRISGQQHSITCPDCSWNGEVDFVKEAKSSGKNRAAGKGKK